MQAKEQDLEQVLQVEERAFPMVLGLVACQQEREQDLFGQAGLVVIATFEEQLELEVCKLEKDLLA